MHYIHEVGLDAEDSISVPREGGCEATDEEGWKEGQDDGEGGDGERSRCTGAGCFGGNGVGGKGDGGPVGHGESRCMATMQRVYECREFTEEGASSQKASGELLQLGAYLFKGDNSMDIGGAVGAKREFRDWQVWQTVWNGVLGSTDRWVQTLEQYRTGNLETEKRPVQARNEMYGSRWNAQRAFKFCEIKRWCNFSKSNAMRYRGENYVWPVE